MNRPPFTSPNMPAVQLDEEFAAVGEELERLQKAKRIAALHAAELVQHFPQLQPEPLPPKPKPPPGHKICKDCGRTLPLVSFHKHPLTTDQRMGKCRKCSYAAN